MREGRRGRVSARAGFILFFIFTKVWYRRGMRYVVAFLLLMSLTTAAEARPKHWFTDPKWWVGEFFIAAAIGADAQSTVLRTNRQVEGNHLLGKNPSRQSVIGVAVLSMGLQTTYHAFCWKLTVGEDDLKGWRIVGYTAIPTEVVAIYGLKGAVHNYHLEFPKAKFSPHMEQH